MFETFHSLTTGPLFLSVLLMFTSIRKVVTSKTILPGTLSTGIKNPMKDDRVRSAVGTYMFMKKGVGVLSKMRVNPLLEKVSFPVTYL